MFDPEMEVLIVDDAGVIRHIGCDLLRELGIRHIVKPFNAQTLHRKINKIFLQLRSSHL
jgi:hypothetical protein